MPSASLCAIGATIAVLVAAPAAAAEARREMSDFHRRALIEGTPTPGDAYSVPLSVEAVAALKRGGELRVFDAAGGEIPSLVHSAVSRGEIFDREVTVFNRTWTEDGTQMLTVELVGRAPSTVNRFVFDIADREYSARVRIESSMDGENWQIVRDGLHLIRHTVESEKIAYHHNVLQIPSSRFRYYRFILKPTRHALGVIEKPTEAPLAITGVAVREVVRRGSSLTVDAPIERFDDPRDDDPRHHYWKLDLGSGDLGVDSVSLTIPEEDFARSASLWEWDVERDRRTRQLAATVVFRYGDDTHSEFSDFSTDARVLVLRIDQGDDAPITVTSARAGRPRQQVRFIGPTAPTLPAALYFDPDEPRQPKYDLARRLREHEVTNFAELGLAPLEPNPAYAPPTPPRSESVPYLLYAMVIPLVVGLGWYIVRTIQRGAPPQ